MNCLRYWARYVRKGEVKGGGIKIGNWISLKRASAASQSKKCCVISLKRTLISQAANIEQVQAMPELAC